MVRGNELNDARVLQCNVIYKYKLEMLYGNRPRVASRWILMTASGALFKSLLLVGVVGQCLAPLPTCTSP